MSFLVKKSYWLKYEAYRDTYRQKLGIVIVGRKITHAATKQIELIYFQQRITVS